MGIPTSGRTDVFIVEQGGEGTVAYKGPKRIAIEVKTINGFGFKKSVGARGDAEGPRTGAIFQAALNGRALQADEVVVIYLSLECLSDRELKALVTKTGGEPAPHRKFLAEWTWSMEELNELVDRELKRLGKVIEMTDAVVAQMEQAPEDDIPVRLLPPRSIPLEMPARGRVTDPSKGTWQVEVDGNIMDAGSTWWCGYCDFKDRCIADGPS